MASLDNSAIHIPVSQACVNIKIIDTSILGAFPLGLFAQPTISGKELIELCYSFYIEHPGSGKRVLFDLGMRKDYTNLPPSYVAMVEQNGWIIQVTHNVAEIIKEHGIDPQSIDSIIWRSVSLTIVLVQLLKSHSFKVMPIQIIQEIHQRFLILLNWWSAQVSARGLCRAIRPTLKAEYWRVIISQCPNHFALTHTRTHV